MHAFTQRLAQRIVTPTPETIAHSLVDAGEIMRMWRHFGGDPGGSGVVGPLSEEVEYSRATADDVQGLKEALVSFVRAQPHHPNLGSAVHALGYLAAPDIKDLLVEVLRDCLGRDSGALYQTILALEELGEDLYGPRTSTGIDEAERNERVAREYLASPASKA